MQISSDKMISFHGPPGNSCHNLSRFNTIDIVLTLSSFFFFFFFSFEFVKSIQTLNQQE